MSAFMDFLFGKAPAPAAHDERQGQEAPAPVAPPPPMPPSTEVYLDPDSPRGRIVILLSEDGSIIEPPMWQNMGAGAIGKAQAASVLATAAATVTTELARDVVLACRPAPVEATPDGE